MSVEFEPVKLGRRRRRVDAVSIGAVAVAIAVATAILKPWGGGPTLASVGEPPPAAVASGGLTGPHATAHVVLPRVLRPTTASSPTWGEIEAVVNRHEAWGIRAVVIEPPAGAVPSADRRFEERWFPLRADGQEVPTTQVDPSDRSIVALGVTFPPAHTPIDVRVWRVGRDRVEWIDTAALEAVPSGGAFLYVRPGVAGGANLAWTAGTYRFDVLVDGSIRRLGVTIPDRFSNVPEPSDVPVAPGELIDPAEATLPDLPIGLFATVDGVAVPMPADEGPALDEAAAWLDVDARTGRAPRSFVAAAYLPRATALGVMLPPGSVVQSATMARLAPDPIPSIPALVEREAGAATSTPHVLYRAPTGGAWTPGTYQISVVWADADGLHDRSWHAELRPGPVQVLAAFDG